MNSFIRLGLGLVFLVGLAGCHACGHTWGHNCGHNDCGCGGSEVTTCEHCVCDGDECDHCESCEECHKPKLSKLKKKMKHSKKSDKYELPREASAYGYGKHVVYTGDDWGGIPHPPTSPGMMPWGSMGSCCDSCNMPMMDGGGMPSMPGSSGGCTSCTANAGMMPQPESFGCTSCQAGQHPQLQSTPATSGGTCAHCGPGNATPDSFYSPMQPGRGTPTPAPPATDSGPMPPTPDTSNPNSNDQSSGGPIQKLQWVPRQL